MSGIFEASNPERSSSALAHSPWLFIAIGVGALVMGLLFLIRPTKAGDAMRNIAQASWPGRVPKSRVGLSAVIGCLASIIAAMLF